MTSLLFGTYTRILTDPTNWDYIFSLQPAMFGVLPLMFNANNIFAIQKPSDKISKQ